MATFFQEDDIIGKAYDARIVRRLLTYIRPYIWLALVAMLLLVLVSLIDLVGPALTYYGIDHYIVPQVKGLSESERGAGLLLVASMYLLVIIIGLVLRYMHVLLLSIVGQRIMFDMRSQMFDHLQRLSLSYFDHNPVGRLMTRLTNDVDSLNEMFTSGAISIFGDILTLFGVAIALLVINWQLALVTFIVMPPLLWITSYFRIAMRDNFRAIRVRLARINAYIAENIAGMSIVQLFNREQRNYQQFDVLNRDYLQQTVRSLLYFILFSSITNFFSALAIALIIWYGGGRILVSALTLGALVAYLQYVDRFFLPIRDLAEKYNILQSAMASSERIFRVLDEPVIVQDPETPKEFGKVQGEIEFRDVWFAYNPGEWVLKGISFKIRPGERVALVGATGAGKTSIISIMSRFYDVQKGAIYVDGIDVRDVRQKDLRKHIGAVLQDPYIFSGTIASNIRLHEEQISDEQIRKAAEYVNAAHFIEQLPHTYDEEVRERGAGLSVGQKQLLAFARAIAFNPEILLILDEATSSVDTETEVLIQDALNKLMLNRTSIVIAHRLSTIRNVDRIIVMHKGRIVEEGSHEELLNRQGVYRKLYEFQYAQ
ncbi:MAG TPA: ABC transporter ATP-binding protein [Ktedonobacteraceae bacterium]|nr:ABC transporter ATP-binding protein [Ktedonobacteraceae bacterium]